MRRILLGVLLLGVVSSAYTADVPPTTYVRAGKLLDVRSGRMLTDQVIVIKAERVERVVKSGEVSIPSGAGR